MGYCTQQDLIDRFGEIELIQLTDVENTGEIVTTAVDQAINDASAEIEGYLSSRFTTPLSPVPTTLVRIGADIARYYLHDDLSPDHVVKRYNDAINFLKGVAKGDISIGITESGVKPSSNNKAVMHSGGNVFNRKDKSFL